MLTRVPDYYEAFHCLAGACRTRRGISASPSGAAGAPF